MIEQEQLKPCRGLTVPCLDYCNRAYHVEGLEENTAPTRESLNEAEKNAANCRMPDLLLEIIKTKRQELGIPRFIPSEPGENQAPQESHGQK